MLVEPRDLVLLLPGQTRYEQPGGGTVTSTERRIRFTPEVPGPRIGEAMCEWEIFMRAGQAALDPANKHLLDWPDAASLRAEMDRCIPLYRGMAALTAEGQSVQYGGPLLCAGGVFANMPGGRARFTPLTPPDAAAGSEPAHSRAASAPAAMEGAHLKVAATNAFYLATRRGKQFNSMVYGEHDPLTGATRRDAIFIAPEDAARLGLRDGDAVVLRPAAPVADTAATASGARANASPALRGTCLLAPVKAGTLQAYWPEANVLIASRLDPASHEPDYNAWVTLEKGSGA
jgi:anaerobic selenocysteine-containing dehydrogenase